MKGGLTMKLKNLAIGALCFGVFAFFAAPDFCAMKHAGGGNGQSGQKPKIDMSVTADLNNAKKVLHFNSLEEAQRHLLGNFTSLGQIQLLKSRPSDPSNPNSPIVYDLYIF